MGLLISIMSRKKNWTHKKRRTTTSNIRLNDKQKKQKWNETHRKKKYMELDNTSAEQEDAVISTDVSMIDNAENAMEVDTSVVQTIDNVQDFNINVSNDIKSQEEHSFSISYQTAMKALIEENKRLTQENIEYKKQCDVMTRKYNIERQKRVASELDVEALINESHCADENPTMDTEYKPMARLSMHITSSITCGITEKSFDPKFMKAFYAYIKIRLKLKVLKSSRSLINLVEILNVYNFVKNNGSKPLELGGTSYGTLDRLMQYRAKKLFQTEICFVINRKWIKSKSVLSLAHDECSQGESQESVVMAFDTDVPTEMEQTDPKYFTPQLHCGNIVRAIWHQNIPSKDAVTSVEWAIRPAIDELDILGQFLFMDKWLNIRDLMMKELAVMTDQNNGAQKTSDLTGLEFKVRVLKKFVCFMHIVDNMLITVKDRLLLEREDKTDDELKADNLIECRNIDIMEICNRLQKALSQQCDSHRNKGKLFEVFVSRSSNKESFLPWCRVTGERRQFTIRNIDAAVSMRDEILSVSQKKQGNKFMVPNARLCMEFGLSMTLLLEAIVMINVKRNYTEQVVICMGKTIQQMNQFLPVMQQTLLQIKRVKSNKIFAMKTLLTMVSFFYYGSIETNVEYESIESNIVINKLLSLESKLKIVESTDDLSKWMNQTEFFDPSGFLQNAISIFTTNNLRLADKYFYNLFKLSSDEFVRVLDQLQGVYGNMYEDMKSRCQLQASGKIPNSVFTVNDRTESLNATGKSAGKYAPNIEDWTKAGHAIGELNKDCWHTFDYLMKYEPKIFEKLLMDWYCFCGPYKLAIYEKKEYKKKYWRAKWKKLRLIINTSKIDTPKARQRAAKKTTKPAITIALPDIDCRMWKYWIKHRDIIIKQKRGLGVLKVRRQLRTLLKSLMKLYRTHKTPYIDRTGLETLQTDFHAWCRKLAQRRRVQR